MTLNKVDTSAMTQTHLVDPRIPARQPKDGSTVASPKDYGSQAPGQPPTTDLADISTAAREMVELKSVVDAGRAALESTSESRDDRVAEVKKRLAAGFYQSAEVRDQVAGRISSLFFDGGLY